MVVEALHSLNILSFNHRNIVDPIVINNNHELISACTLLLLTDILCNALFLLSFDLHSLLFLPDTNLASMLTMTIDINENT
jgi:hypothetical protein